MDRIEEGQEARIRPTDGLLRGWPEFEKWADQNGIGTYQDDWEPWWECWKAGWAGAVERIRGLS